MPCACNIFFAPKQKSSKIPQVNSMNDSDRTLRFVMKDIKGQGQSTAINCFKTEKSSGLF